LMMINPLITTYLSLRLTLSCKPSSLANFGIVAHAASGDTLPCKTQPAESFSTEWTKPSLIILSKLSA
jgi:hypothetical protein